MFKTANPALSSKTFSDVKASSSPMTVRGTVNKSFILLGLLMATAGFTWMQALSHGISAVGGWLMLGTIGGLVLAIVTIFKKEWAPRTAPAYALCEGLVLGGISVIFEAQYPGIVMQAVGLTFGTLFCLLGAYQSGLVKVTENFKLGIMAATGGLFLLYLVSFILGFFGVNLPFFGNGPVGILFSVAVCAIAALNLVLDFDFIEKGAEHGAPKYMEWYAAFGLMVTLIWLYIEILRLLTKLRSQND